MSLPREGVADDGRFFSDGSDALNEDLEGRFKFMDEVQGLPSRGLEASTWRSGLGVTIQIDQVVLASLPHTRVGYQ